MTIAGHVDCVCRLGALCRLEGTADQIGHLVRRFKMLIVMCCQMANVIWCVGMGGSSHWSASFSIEADENGLIKSDIACLTKKLISDRFPDSNNQLAADVRPTLFSRARAELDTGSDVIVVIKAIAGDEFSTIEDGIFRVAPLKAAGNFKSKFVRQASPPSKRHHRVMF